MRNPIQKRILREMKQNLLKYLGMTLILVSVICAGTSFKASMNGALDYVERIKEENRQEDGFFETAAPLSEEALRHFEADGVYAYPNFYATENEYPVSSKLLLFDERTQVDIPTVCDGRLPEAADEIALDRVFAQNHALAPGDTATLLGRTYRVVGTVSLPDYTALFMNNTDMVMNTEHFGVSVLSAEGFDQIGAESVICRYSYRFADRTLSKAEKNSTEEEMQKYLALSGCAVSTFLPRSQNQSIAFLEVDMGTDGPAMTVFVYLLIALIAFIFAILTNSTIEREAVMIGTLRASGYRRGELIWHYLQPTLIVAVVGSGIGNLLGYTVMLRPFLDMYQTMYSIGPLSVRFDLPMFLLTTVLPVVLMVGINLAMMVRRLSLSPLAFLRKELKKGKPPRAVRLPRVGFIRKFRLRVILQNPGSYILLFTGVFLASFLLMFGIGLSPLIEHYTQTVDESLPYEYQYILKAPVETQTGERVFLKELDTWFALGNKDIGISCFGIDRDSRYFGDAYTEDGATLSTSAAKKLGIEVGDTLVLKDTGKDLEYEFTVTGLYPYDAAMALFIDRDVLLERLDIQAGTYNCLLSDTRLELDESCLAKQISRDDLIGAVSQVMDSFDTVIQVINVFSVAVYVTMMYILTRVIIEKNALSISYLKVFGYRDREINSVFLTTTTLVVILSLIVCIPIEVVLFKLTLVFLSVMVEGYMTFYLPGWVYAAIVAIGLVTYLGINAINARNVKRISLSAALKNRE